MIMYFNKTFFLRKDSCICCKRKAIMYETVYKSSYIIAVYTEDSDGIFSDCIFRIIICEDCLKNKPDENVICIPKYLPKEQILKYVLLKFC